MIRAVWNGKVLAESNDTVVFEGNHYFPPETLRMEFFHPCWSRRSYAIRFPSCGYPP